MVFELRLILVSSVPSVSSVVAWLGCDSFTISATITPVSTTNNQSVILECDVPLSQSLIWRLQREFYLQRGLKAWSEDLVPNFITNNPFFAETYSRIILGFFEDCLASGLRAGIPLRIVELGSGTGKFCYLFLRNLTVLLRARGFEIKTICYCMTDCSEELMASWHGNSYLAEFVEAGILEFGVLKAGEEIGGSFLQGRVEAGSPLVVIANYVFDSLPQDAFVIKDGQPSELLVTADASSTDAGQQPRLSGLHLSYKSVPVGRDRYPDTSWNHILELYRNHLTAATVLFPVQALKTVQAFGQITHGPMLLLVADKGFAHEDALLFSQGDPTLEFHAPNCFSQMVNFDAIAKYFQANGGQALLPDKHFSSLNICSFLQSRRGVSFPMTEAAYRETQSALGADDLFMLLAWLNAHMEEMTVPQILAALRLTRWDPIAFMRLFPVLARQIRMVSAERTDLRNAVLRTLANHYPISARENEIAFQCGVILLELRFFEDALAMFKTSQRIFAPSAATSYNLGLCFHGLGRRAEAIASVIESCSLDPTFEPSRLFREKLEREAD